MVQGVLVQSSCALVARLVAAARGVSFCLLDLQHGAASLSHAAQLIQSINGGGTPCITRIMDPSNMADIGRALDLGSSAVVVPGVSNAEHAQAIADAARYPPKGFRSWGKLPAARPPFQVGNRTITHIGMIENTYGAEEVGDIAKTDIDALYIGPADLSLSLLGTTTPRQDSDTLHRVVAQAVDACRAADKPIGIHCPTPAALREWEQLGIGFDFVTLGSDTSILQHGLAQVMEQGGSSSSSNNSNGPATTGDGGAGDGDAAQHTTAPSHAAPSSASSGAAVAATAAAATGTAVTGAGASEDAEEEELSEEEQLSLLEERLNPARIAEMLEKAMGQVEEQDDEEAHSGDSHGNDDQHNDDGGSDEKRGRGARKSFFKW